MLSLILFVLTFVVSMVLTAVFRLYALQKSFLDVPNARSSHEVPTPRGGGLAIVISFMFALSVLYWRNIIPQPIFAAFWGGGLLVALIGLADDFAQVRSSVRILVHFVASGAGLYFLGGFPPVVIGSIVIDPGIVRVLFCIIFLVWLLNLFNFMDGIDGIAGSQAIFCAGGASLIIFSTGGGGSVIVLLLFVAACAGFLVWNWPPAKIFMGDVGSGFLGIMLGFFIIMTMQSGELSFCTWLILLGTFLVDATVTLLTRMMRGVRWYEAHRSHAYQILSRRLRSHQKVTLLVLMLNIIWLLPLASLSHLYPEDALVILLITFVPMLFAVYSIGAGKEGS